MVTRRIVPVGQRSLESNNADPFVIVGRNVTFKRGRKRILDEHNWCFQSNQLSAILGPSGCGKSTLLNILLGRLKRNITGFVGVSQSNEKSNLNISVSFVGQSDHLSHFLTVHESLLLSSRLKGPWRSSIEHEKHVSKALELLNLESARITKISRLSGGQKRRLSIALELLGNPAMLILDEPTTGLDSGATQQLVCSLHKLLIESRNAGHRMAIIATIHQPSARVFAQFQHIHVMSKHGKALFSNSPDKLLEMLIRIDLECPRFHNPADFICELAAGEYGQAKVDSLCDITNRNGHIALCATGELHIDWPKQSFLSQVRYLTGLLICSDIRQPLVLFIRLLEPPLIAFNNGLIFGMIGKANGCVPSLQNFFDIPPGDLFRHQDEQRLDVYQNLANIFFAVLNFFYVGMTPTLLFFPNELGIVAKQYINGWHTVQSYFTAKILVELLFVTINVLSFQSLWHPITGQDIDAVRFAATSCVFAGFHMFGFLQGIIFSGIFSSSPVKAVYMGVLSMLPFVLISGFIVRTERIPEWIQPASYLSYYRFGYELMVIIIYGNDRCSPRENFRLESMNNTLKVPRWLKLIQYTAPDTSGLKENQLGEWAINQWFPRKNKLEKSWILDELDLTNDGSQMLISIHHTAIFASLLLIWFFTAFLIMRHRMSRPAV